LERQEDLSKKKKLKEIEEGLKQTKQSVADAKQELLKHQEDERKIAVSLDKVDEYLDLRLHMLGEINPSLMGSISVSGWAVLDAQVQDNKRFDGTIKALANERLQKVVSIDFKRWRVFNAFFIDIFG
jgi:hypothetical protein